MTKKALFKSKFYLTSVGLMTALVFASNYIQTPPLLIGSDATRFHVANGFCLLSGFLLGPVGGGFAAGVGSMLYDFTFPQFVASSPFTLVFKFSMAYLCGLIAYGGKADGRKTLQNILAALSGNLLYIVLHLSKTYVTERVVKSMTHPVALGIVASKGFVSLINCGIAVAVAVPLAIALRTALDRNNLNPRKR